MYQDVEVYLVIGEGFILNDDTREQTILYNGLDKKTALEIANKGYDDTVFFSVYKDGKLVSEYLKRFGNRGDLSEKWKKNYGFEIEL